MQRQGSFTQAEYAGKKKQTRRDRFLAEMEEVVPWARLVERLRSFYPKGARGRAPIGLERMLRIYFLQQCTGWPTRPWRTRYTIARRCAASPASICRWRRFRTRRRAELPALAGEARPDPGAVRRDRGDAGGARPVDAPGNNR